MNTLSPDQIDALARELADPDHLTARSIISITQSELLKLNPDLDEPEFDIIDSDEKRKAFAPVQAGDECQGHDGKWFNLEKNIGDKMFTSCIYRRKRQPRKAKWRPVSEGVTYPCCMISPQGNRFLVNGPSDSREIQAIATHFTPVSLPERPAPDMSDVEKAFRLRYPDIIGDSTYGAMLAHYKVGFLDGEAGYEAAKKGEVK